MGVTGGQGGTSLEKFVGSEVLEQGKNSYHQEAKLGMIGIFEKESKYTPTILGQRKFKS